MEFSSHVDYYAPNHWAANQPLFMCLCCVLTRESLQPVHKTMELWKKPCAAVQWNTVLQKAGLVFGLGCHGTQLVKIERCHGCILFAFAFRQYSSVNFALLFVHPFRCLDGCSPLSWHPPPFDLSSKHRMRMRCKKERLKETKSVIMPISYDLEKHTSIFSQSGG